MRERPEAEKLFITALDFCLPPREIGETAIRNKLDLSGEFLLFSKTADRSLCISGDETDCSVPDVSLLMKKIKIKHD